MVSMTRRREARSPFFALVMRRSACGRSRFGLVSVVVIALWRNSSVARPAMIFRPCAGYPPSRVPLVGAGMVVLLEEGVRSLLVAEVVGVGVQGRRIEAGRGVLQRQPEVGELRLDLIDGLLAEVADVEQIGLGTGGQL